VDPIGSNMQPLQGFFKKIIKNRIFFNENFDEFKKYIQVQKILKKNQIYLPKIMLNLKNLIDETRSSLSM